MGETNPPATPYPLKDEQLLEVIEDFAHKPEKQFALQLMAAYGLRPADLLYLKVRGNELWSDYRKAAGHGKRTMPRMLRPLFVANQDWNLLERFKGGESVVGLGEPGGGQAGVRIGEWLRYSETWQRLKVEAHMDGEELKPYAFRHSFSRGQMRGIPPKVLAGFMGHSLETHLSVYSKWNLKDDALSYFD